MKKKIEYSLLSSPMVCAPGCVAYLICMYRSQKAVAVRALRAGWSMPKAAAVALLSGEAPHVIDGETVKFSA